jgi:hypothetical protein
VIFAQLGNDVVQGDGSIASAIAASPVYVGRVSRGCRLRRHHLRGHRRPDPQPVLRGGDRRRRLHRGGGGSDVVFGGSARTTSSAAARACSRSRRRAAARRRDYLFGGAGLRINRTEETLDALGNVRHTRDADAIVGDNGNLYRIVGTGGAQATTGYLTFNYDFNTTRAGRLRRGAPHRPARDRPARQHRGRPGLPARPLR